MVQSKEKLYQQARKKWTYFQEKIYHNVHRTENQGVNE